MKLQGKAILAFNILLAVACVIVGVLGYFTADHGFGVALEQKAVHDLEEIHAVLEARYPGAWESKPDGLYKGAKKIDGDDKLLDELGQLSGNNVTMFNQDTRVATTFKDATGKRPVGTKRDAGHRDRDGYHRRGEPLHQRGNPEHFGSCGGAIRVQRRDRVGVPFAGRSCDGAASGDGQVQSIGVLVRAGGKVRKSVGMAIRKASVS